MSANPTMEPLNDLLKPLGFKRRRRMWNRRTGSFVDVFDVQVSKTRDTFTINVGVMDLDAYRILWAREYDNFVEQSVCTVSARVGALIDRKDKWWRIDSASSSQNAADDVARYALPFIERMHSHEAMKQWLLDSNVLKQRYPPPIINLAILESFLGNRSQGCALLAELRKTTVEAWRPRVVAVAKELQCSQAAD